MLGLNAEILNFKGFKALVESKKIDNDLGRETVTVFKNGMKVDKEIDNNAHMEFLGQVNSLLTKKPRDMFYQDIKQR